MPKHLIHGFQKFLKDHYDPANPLMERLVAEGQNPDYFIVSCIDSRAHAGAVLHTDPGTYFAHKSMGAIVRPYKQGTTLSSSLQFALIHNNVKTIIILGHTSCGAVKALIEKIDDPEIASFINVAKAGVDNAKNDTDTTKDLQRLTEEHILRLSRKNLETFPSVQKRLNDGDLTIKAWLFDMHEGALHEYNEDTDQFDLLVKKED